MATLGWHQPYWTYGDKVLTRMFGRRVCVIVAATPEVAHELCKQANCWFQFHAYGCVDKAAHFVELARELGFPISGEEDEDDDEGEIETISEQELLEMIDAVCERERA
jgi:hypothetical protein